MKNLKITLLILCLASLGSFAQEKETNLAKKIPKSEFNTIKESYSKKKKRIPEGDFLIDPVDPNGGDIIVKEPYISSSSSSLKWSGTNDSFGKIYRTGITGIGLSNPPSDTKLYVKADNLKVGIVSEVNHSLDYQFGIISAVNRPTTKAISVLLKESGIYNDKFVVMGNGNVRATEVRVKTNIFPDYVFEKDYKLMSLKDVDKFIKKNKHLPNIPKGEEIIKKGLDLGNIQVKQMEKIEELYLHIIELEKRIKKLEDKK